MGDTHRSKYPVISRRSGTASTGVRLVGPDAEVFAEDRYRAGTPPVHGLDHKLPTSPRVSEVDVGDKLGVRLVDGRWQVFASDGHCLGTLKWRMGDQDKIDARTGAVIHYHELGTLHVTKLLIKGREDEVIDFGGYVTPSP